MRLALRGQPLFKNTIQISSMNKHKISILGFALIVLVSSCRKNDVRHEEQAAAPAATEAVAAVKPASWQSYNWKATSEDKFKVYNTSISDSAITASVVESGMVLVYKKDGNSVNLLPFSEKGSDLFWHYQVSEGTIGISLDAYGTSKDSQPQSEFSYFVFTPAQIAALEAKGTSKAALMSISYENAVAITRK